jgi:kumamolisin
MMKRKSYRIHAHQPSLLSPHSFSNNFYLPSDLMKIYDIGSPLSSSATKNIAIIELGGTYRQSDLTSYWRRLRLSITPNIIPMYVDGYVISNLDANTEVTMDIEIVGGICPNSNIYVYFAPNTEQGFMDALTMAVNNTTTPFSTISISWGAPENEWSSNGIRGMNSILQKASQLGITVCVASGDNGSTDGETDGRSHVDFPGSSPYVLSCGGTSLYCPSRVYTDKSTRETVWNNSMGATGGGFSSVFARPTYQTGFHTNTRRGIPDVSGSADPQNGWIVFVNGSYVQVGGTSAVAPLWAAYLALLQRTRKWWIPILYQIKRKNSSSFHTISNGNNGSYSANRNLWNPCAGLGTPKGDILTYLLNNSSLVKYCSRSKIISSRKLSLLLPPPLTP